MAFNEQKYEEAKAKAYAKPALFALIVGVVGFVLGALIF